MRASLKGVWGYQPVVVAASLVAALLASQPASAQCVGDCEGDNRVTIDDLIKGVNIALAVLPVSECPAFADDMGEVTISQLVLGVNNALNGCPEPVPTATATETATEAATATATDTPAEPTATATDSPPPATATATSTVPADTPTATSTVELTATPTSTMPPTPTITNTPGPTATATEPFIPPGEAAGGRAAIVSTGLGGIQSIVGAVVAIVTNQGTGALVFDPDEEIGGPADVDNCPISGTTSQDCTEMGSGGSKTIRLVLGADMCVAPGPAGGTGEFDGMNAITIDSAPFLFNSCSGPVFLSGTFTIDSLSVILRNNLMQNLVGVSIPEMNGTLALTPKIGDKCLVSALDLTLNGTLISTLTDGSGVQVFFDGTQVKFDDITFNSDCVPLKYRLTFNGSTTFSPMVPILDGSAGLGSDAFPVSFMNFQLKQDATADPVKVEMSGSMSSDCFGGSVGLTTFAPVAVAAGQICPDSGTVNVTSMSHGNATVTYMDGGVTVTPEGGTPKMYLSCLAPDLLMCLPQ